MYIIKLDHKIDEPTIFDKSVTEHLSDLRIKSRQHQIVLKKNSTLSERFHSTESEENQSDRRYSSSFRKMMNKVIHRINRRNNFFKDNQTNDNINQNPIHSLKEEAPQATFSLDYPHRKNKIFYQQNKLKISGFSRVQNESNLLQRKKKQNPFIKTSVSFVKNKQFKKTIHQRRSKSFSSDMSVDSYVQKGKQNFFMLNNTRYCPAEFKRIMLEESFKVGSFIPKITAKENYQQMQQLLKVNIESKRNKIDVGKKLFHKKMLEKQKHHQIVMETKIRQNSNWGTQHIFKSRDKFQPWATGEDFLQEGFRISRKEHY